jgi:hypothetical protein
MTKAPLTQFEPDPERLAIIRKCMNYYNVGDPGAEWPNNIISQRTVVYGSGHIAREGDSVHLAVAPDELELCRRLSTEIAALMAGVEVGMGSCAGDEFHGFFIAGSVIERAPSSIDEVLIRSLFGGTIFPPATISVEPLSEGTEWWAEVELYGDDPPGTDYLVPWRSMICWFCKRPEFTTSAFVRIGDNRAFWELPKEEYPPGTDMPGSVLPRLAIGLTPGGSLVGLFGYSVKK